MLTVPRRPRDEQGSVMVAIIVITIVSMVLATLLLSVTNDLNRAQADDERSKAFQFANAGVDHAVYRIDRNELDLIATGSYEPLAFEGPDGGVSRFRDVVTIGNDTIEIEAQLVESGKGAKWRVASTGRDSSGRVRTAVTTVEAEDLLMDGFFAKDGIDLNGNPETPLEYDSATDPAAGFTVSPISTSFGTNGSVTGPGVGNSIDHYSGFNMYGYPSQELAEEACQGCVSDETAVTAHTDQRVLPSYPVPPSAGSCPHGGTLGAVDTGGGVYTIPPGDYQCPTVTFDERYDIVAGTNPDGTPGRVRIWATTAIEHVRRASSDDFGVVNGAVNVNGAPSRFQLFLNDPPGIEEPTRSLCDIDFWGLVYAPGLNLRCDGIHQTLFHGAVVLQKYEGNGAHFRFIWDADSDGLLHTGKFVVKDWRECPPNATNC